jgi:hypothetical protein
MGRDILMRGSQLMLGWLVVVTIANRPWSLVKWLGAPCVSCTRSGANYDSRHCQHRANHGANYDRFALLSRSALRLTTSLEGR